MIYVNLLKNVNVRVAGASKSLPGITYGEVQPTDRKAVFLKLFILLLVPYSIKILESQTLSGRYQEVNAARTELDVVTQEVTKLGSAVDLVSRFVTDRKKLESRLKVIEDLAKFRLRELMALEKLQKSIPQRIWLKEFAIESENVSMNGVALSESDIDTFVDELSKGNIFVDVFYSTSDDGGQERAEIPFEIKCRLGSGDGKAN